jgi:transcriptional regulator with XRE-family HTH domain
MKEFKNIAQLIKVKRKRAQISQAYLSKALGYKNGQFVSNVERGLCSIPISSILRVSELLETPVFDLRRALVLDFEAHVDKYLKENS